MRRKSNDKLSSYVNEDDYYHYHNQKFKEGMIECGLGHKIRKK